MMRTINQNWLRWTEILEWAERQGKSCYNCFPHVQKVRDMENIKDWKQTSKDEKINKVEFILIKVI